MTDQPTYTKPTSQVDLERRSQDDYVPHGRVVQGETVPNSEDGFIGVDPDYRNFANDTEKPLVPESGPEKDLFESRLADDYDNSVGATPEGVKSEEDDKDDEEDEQEKKSDQSSAQNLSPRLP